MTLSHRHPSEQSSHRVSRQLPHRLTRRSSTDLPNDETKTEEEEAHEREVLPRHTSLTLKITILVVFASAAAFVLSWTLHELGISGWISLPISVCIFAIVGYLFSRHLTRSLHELRDAAKAMADGDYSARVTPHSTDEVGELATGFNQMAAELEHADQRRKDLIANVSHELRTPVAAMRAQAENMADGVVEPTPQNLELIVTQSKRLGDLIAFLLDLSRLEAGAASLHITDFCLADFLKETIQPLEIADASHDHHIAVHVPSSIMLEGDTDRLGQLFTNIINNALKHSADGTRILIEAHEDSHDHTVVTNVINLGSYIAKKDRERLFRRFVQGGDHPGTSSGGTGIGLSIARWAARLHGGTVRVVDDQRGVDFEIRLPRKHVSTNVSTDTAGTSTDVSTNTPRT